MKQDEELIKVNVNCCLHSILLVYFNVFPNETGCKAKETVEQDFYPLKNLLKKWVLCA